ncbi:MULTISPECIES: hypothetical protein [unclassified Nocardioides]|uniref:hypothetical protein n=1 Tax=unclassified Nocardioides TaxID=2615069 RepID=UPI000A8C77A4|nr:MULTISPECIES: hypothetical protein [unclassified Nocardioides]
MNAVRPDVRLEAAPMQPVACTTCEAEVLARKSSWDQSTLQWDATALERCIERRTTPARSERPNRNAFAGCAALRASIREAAVRGELDVQSDDPLRTNPEAIHD